MCSYVVGRLDERNDDSKLRTLPQGYYPAQLLSLTATGEVPFPTAKTIINSILKPYTQAHNFYLMTTQNSPAVQTLVRDSLYTYKTVNLFPYSRSTFSDIPTSH